MPLSDVPVNCGVKTKAALGLGSMKSTGGSLNVTDFFRDSPSAGLVWPQPILLVHLFTPYPVLGIRLYIIDDVNWRFFKDYCLFLLFGFWKLLYRLVLSVSTTHLLQWREPHNWNKHYTILSLVTLTCYLLINSYMFQLLVYIHMFDDVNTDGLFTGFVSYSVIMHINDYHCYRIG